MTENPFVPFSDIRYQLTNPLNLHPDLREAVANGLCIIVDIGTAFSAIKTAWAAYRAANAAKIVTPILGKVTETFTTSEALTMSANLKKTLGLTVTFGRNWNGELVIQKVSNSIGQSFGIGASKTETLAQSVSRMFNFIATSVKNVPPTVATDLGRVALEPTFFQRVTGTGAASIGVAGASSSHIPLAWSPFIFGSSFFLTGVMADTFNDLKDWALDNNPDGESMAKAFVAKVETLVRNKSALTSMGFEDIKTMWLDYQSACKTLGVSPVPFPIGYFEDSSLTDANDLSESDYLKLQHDLDMIEIDVQNTNYQANQEQANLNYQENIALQNANYQQNMATAQEYDLQKMDQQYQNESMLIAQRIFAQYGNESALAQQRFDNELKLLRERLALQYDYDVKMLDERYAAQRYASFVQSQDAWDLLNQETQITFLQNGITRERYLDYNRVKDTVSQSVLDKLFPEFMDAPEAIEDSLKYTDVMEWIMNMDETAEPLEYSELYEGDDEYKKNTITVEDFYGMVKGERFKPPVTKRKFTPYRKGFKRKRYYS